MLKLTVGKKRLALFILAGFVLLMVSNKVDELRLYQGAFVATYALGITSIILLTGHSGQLSLGHSALMAVGAYAGALTTNNLHWHPAIALVMATLIAGIFGLLLGLVVARLSGPYLAGTTLALAVSLPTLANQFPILGGEQGLTFDVGSAPSKFGENFSQYKWFFWIAALATLIMIWTIANIASTRYGRTFRAMRDNSIAAELAGVNVGVHKVIAFTVSAGVAGLTGAVVTGVYNLKGVILGALVLVAIPEIADSLVSRIGGSEGFATTLPGLLVSSLLILAVLFAPNGPGQLLHRKSKKEQV
jgi:branched-chain amino acid transport system permease protein